MGRRRDTPPPRTGASEKEVLRGFLDYLRDAVASKTEGLAEDDLRAPGVDSGTNLLGLVKHLTHVERFVFFGERARSWPATFHVDDSQSTAEVLADYAAAVERSNAVIDACTDLEQPVRDDEKSPSVRWALVHMVEETGRHAGHADILRELIDGRTGR